MLATKQTSGELLRSLTGAQEHRTTRIIAVEDGPRTENDRSRLWADVVMPVVGAWTFLAIGWSLLDLTLWFLRWLGPFSLVYLAARLGFLSRKEENP